MTIAKKYCSDKRLRIIPRPEDLCLSSTNLQDLIRYVPTITEVEHILWGHVTTPLVDANIYDVAIESYLAGLNNGYDSLVSVKELKTFSWISLENWLIIVLIFLGLAHKISNHCMK